ncbi:MAG TPA: hypothetical protein VMW58_09260 [Anaerolineae bacterium]|nr:hypothetical protein [Anaerolineae bacterium]
MTPEAYRRIRRAVQRKIIEREHYIHWALERDIMFLLAQGDDYGFTVGWPHHGMVLDPGWPEQMQWQN